MSPLPRSVVAPHSPGRDGSIAVVAVAVVLVTGGCGGGDSPPPAPPVDRAALLDSTSCQSCHPTHYTEWSASMHSYASDDPLFLAMNRRGQRETGGKLGDFCIKCHAPVALREGKTTDGLNLDEVARPLKGVTCAFCHSVESVADAHNNSLQLARDGVMLGGITDPVPNAFHKSAYSRLLDSTRVEATAACGSCHDIVNTKGTAIERTYAEWRGSLFASTQVGQGCGGCHLGGRDASAAATNTDKLRRVHDHRMPGVDIALTSWPGAEEQRKLVVEQLGTAAQGALCLDERTNRIQVILDNVAAGHMWPSGTASDRRVWVEVAAYAGGQMMYQTGAVPPGGSVETVDDPDLWLIRDCFFDDSGHEVHQFWQAARYTSNLLPPSPFIGPGVRPMPRGHYRWDVPRPDSTRVLPAVPERITMKVHMRAVGDAVLKDLIDSGDLDPAVAARIPTFDIAGGEVEWTRAAVNFMYVDRGSLVTCVAPYGFTSTTMSTFSQARCDPAAHP